MLKNPRLVSLAAVTLAATAALTGCSTSAEEASEDYCEKVDTLESEVAALLDLVRIDASVDEASEQREKVAEAYDDAVSAAEDLAASIRDSASDAYSSFQDAVGDIPGDLSLSEATDEYTSASQAYLDELRSISDQAGCAEQVTPDE